MLLMPGRTSLRLSRRIVLVVIDRPANVVLPLIDLLMLLLRQAAVIRSAIIRCLAVDAGLAALDVTSLTRCHLARPHAIRDAILLVEGAIVYRPHRSRLRSSVIDRGKLVAIPARSIAMADLARRR